MEKKPFLSFWNNKRYHALLVGLVVASVHFAITSIMNPVLYPYPNISFTDLIIIVLTAPSMAALLIISLLSSIALPDYLDASSPLLVFVIVSSSSFYGVTAAFLASNRRILRWAGVIFVGLLILGNCLILFALAARGR